MLFIEKIKEERVQNQMPQRLIAAVLDIEKKRSAKPRKSKLQNCRRCFM